MLGRATKDMIATETDDCQAQYEDDKYANGEVGGGTRIGEAGEVMTKRPRKAIEVERKTRRRMGRDEGKDRSCQER